MDLGVVGTVYRKELRETLRDRRTLIVMVVLPICLYPIVGISITQWIGAHEARRGEEVSRVRLQGDSWPGLEQALERSGKIEIDRTGGDGKRDLIDQKLDLLLSVPPGAVDTLAEDRAVRLVLTYDETRGRSRLARERVRAAVDKMARRIVKARLQRRELAPGLIEPLVTQEKGVSGRDRGRQVAAGTVPLLVILMVLLGAFYPAIDVTAGEKERGTLETLLAAPVDRVSLLAGKYLVVASTALFTGLLNMGSMGLTLVLGFGPALRAAGMSATGVPWTAVALTVVAMVPAALFFAATMIAIAALGRSFKEAQNLLTPIYMVFMLPALAAQLPGVSLTPVIALLPVVNISLLTRDLIAGDASLLPGLLTVGSVLLYTGVALRLAARIFESERLLFAPDPGSGPRRKLWALLLGREVDAGPRVEAPSSAQAAVLFMVVMALILLVGQPLQSRHLIGGLLVTEWLLIGLPVLLLVRLGRLHPGSALAIKPAGPIAVLGAILAGLSAWYLVGVLVELVQQRIFPMPEELIRSYHKALFTTQRSLAVDLFALALSPAICEELLFRGVLLQATRRTMSAGWAIVLNGALFGLFHMNPYRFVSTMVLGFLLAFIVLRAGSILPAMVFHFLNNASAIVAGRALGEQALEEGGTALSWPLLAGALALFAVGLTLATRVRAGLSAPPDRSG